MSDRRRQDGKVIPVDFRPHIVIITKHRIYDLEPDAVGQPLEEVFGAAVPRSLHGARRYMTEDGWVIGRPEPGEPLHGRSHPAGPPSTK